MKFPLFGGKDRSIQKQQAQDQAERLLVESFRTLSQVCSRFADFIETQRLARQGYEEQGRYLERLDRRDGGSQAASAAGNDKKPNGSGGS